MTFIIIRLAFTCCALLTVVLVVSAQQQQVQDGPVTATAKFMTNGIEGTINLTQWNKTSSVHIFGKLSGLKPGKHGFHIHTNGNITGSNCAFTGSHYNPLMVNNLSNYNLETFKIDF